MEATPVTKGCYQEARKAVKEGLGTNANSVLLQSDHHRVNAAIIQMRLNLPSPRRQRLRAEIEDVLAVRAVIPEEITGIRATTGNSIYGVIDRCTPRELLDRHCADCSGDNGSCRIRELKLDRTVLPSLKTRLPSFRIGCRNPIKL